MSTNSKILVIQNSISVKTVTHGSFQIDDFSSLKSSKLHMSAEIPSACMLYMLQFTKDSMIVLPDLEKCIQCINDNCGFTFVGWHIRGIINNKSLIASQNIKNGDGGNLLPSTIPMRRIFNMTQVK